MHAAGTYCRAVGRDRGDHANLKAPKELEPHTEVVSMSGGTAHQRGWPSSWRTTGVSSTTEARELTVR